MRLTPTASGGSLRVLKKDMKLGDYNLPAGTNLQIHFFSQHRNPKYWDRPLEFLPVRLSGAFWAGCCNSLHGPHPDELIPLLLIRNSCLLPLLALQILNASGLANLGGSQHGLGSANPWGSSLEAYMCGSCPAPKDIRSGILSVKMLQGVVTGETTPMNANALAACILQSICKMSA